MPEDVLVVESRKMIEFQATPGEDLQQKLQEHLNVFEAFMEKSGMKPDAAWEEKVLGANSPNPWNVPE